MTEESAAFEAPSAAARPAEGVDLTVRNLRGIAHPVRVRLLGELRAHGPATATMLARRLALNTGATSYHLRQLATYGFVVEQPGRGSGRERWWQAAHRTSRLDRAAFETDDGAGMGEAYLRSVAEVYAAQLLRAVEEVPAAPVQWRGSLTLSDYQLQLTAAELRELVAEVAEVLGRRRPAAPDQPRVPGTELVSFQFQAFRLPGGPDQ